MCDVLQVNTTDDPFRKGVSGDVAAFYETQIWNWPTQIIDNNHRNWFPLIQIASYIQLYQIMTSGFTVKLRDKGTNTDSNTDKAPSPKKPMIGQFINGTTNDNVPKLISSTQLLPQLSN
jgi:hypothetical protein